MKYLYTGDFFFSGDYQALEIKRGAENSTEIIDECLVVTLNPRSTVDDLRLVEGFSIEGPNLQFGLWQLHKETTINRLKIVPLYEYRNSTLSCYIQEKEDLIDYNGLHALVRPDTNFPALLRKFFYVINPQEFVFNANFTGFILGHEYTTTDRMIYQDSDFMLIDVWNYIYDWQMKMAELHPTLQVYQFDDNFDDSYHEHLKMLETTHVYFEGRGGHYTGNYWQVDKYLTKQIVSIKASFQYQCIDRRLLDARVVDYYQSAFLTSMRSSLLDELPKGVEREIDVDYTCTPSEIEEITVKDLSTDTETERYMYTFNFDVEFICPIYRRLIELPKILEVLYNLHLKKD